MGRERDEWMEFIGYDFDNTVYHGDSSTHFTFWCLGHYPATWLHLPAMLWWGALFKLKVCPKTKFKSHLFGYLRHLPDINRVVERFWAGHEKNLKAWYLAKPHERDVILSASPTFLLEPVCTRLGVQKLIATPMNPRTGVIQGENCWGAEKVTRLNQVYAQYHMLEFYSDSRSDDPLARLADQSFLVKGNQILPW